MATGPSTALQAERVATLYRRIVLTIGAQLLGSFLGQMLAVGGAAADATALAILGLLLVVAALAASVACAVFTYQLTSELGDPVPWLWALAIFVPCVSIVVLLVLSSRAQAWCKERGIKVGLLGPTKESIEKLKRESSVDRIFD
jgi:hypothetical protein